MTDNQDKKLASAGSSGEVKEEIKTPEKKISATDQEVHFDWGKEKKVEKREILKDDKIISAELRREIETMEADDDAKAEAKKKAEKIEFLGEKEKLEHLLQTAREKGVVFAIQVARKMNEPYLLDVFHDILAREGFYKNMTKPSDDDNDDDNDDNKN
jgi:hypothetical protein